MYLKENKTYEQCTFTDSGASRWRRMQCFLMFAFLLAGLAINALADTLSPGEILYRQAQGLEEEMSCTQAAELYNHALPLLLQEGNTDLAYDCDEAVRRLKIGSVAKSV